MREQFLHMLSFDIAGLCSWNWVGGSCSDQALSDSQSFVVPVQNCTDVEKTQNFSFLPQHQMLIDAICLLILLILIISLNYNI